MKHRFEVLDIFRGLFASFVFLFHLSAFSQTPLINNNFVYNSDMFVDFFFVLSGFVIAYSYEHLEGINNMFTFLKKRFKRIYPLHFFMLLLFLIVEGAKHLLSAHIHVNNLGGSNDIYTFISSLLLLNSFPVFHVKDVSWNIPSWSISAEMAAYVVFGFAILFINARHFFKQRSWLYLLIVLAAAASMVLINKDFDINYSFNYGFIRGILGFFVGVLCMNTFTATKDKVFAASNTLFSVLEIVSLVVMCICIYEGFALKHAGLVFELVFFACIYIFSFEKGIVSELLKKIGILKKVGKYSYSIYMTHALLISLFNVLFIRILKFPPSAYVYLVFLNYLLIYFVSAWTYKHIEIKFYQPSKGKKFPDKAEVKKPEE